MRLDRRRRQVLAALQEGLPVVERPFAALAERIGATEDDVLALARELKRAGLIRRFGGVFDSRAMGFATTLCAARVRPERLAELARRVSRFPQVTHNYRRDGRYNLWFTLTARDPAALRRVMTRIRGMAPVEELVEFPVRKRFKLKLEFDF